MPFAIELFLDEASSDVVRRVWREVAEVGASRFMHQSGARPHVTLAVADNVDVPRCERALRALAERTPALPVRFVSFGIFPTEPSVVFLAPVVTPTLLELHARFHRAAAGFLTAPWDYYRPNYWVPHCTLAMDLPPETVVAALEVSRALHLPLEGSLVEIGLVEFRPTKQLVTFPLRGSGLR